MPTIRPGNWRSGASITTLLLLAACTLDEIYGKPNPDADVAGEWTINAWNCCNPSGGSQGVGGGSVFLVTAGGLSGHALLVGDSAMTFTGQLTYTSKTGADLSFRAGRCAFNGTVRGASGENIQGSWQCTGLGGGEWYARRASLPATAAWPLAERTLVQGGTLVAQVTVKDMRGYSLLRDFAYLSSDTTVAQVTRRGMSALITVTGPGAAVITANAFDVSASLTIRGIPTVRFGSVSAGQAHACGVTTDGMALCWGSGGGGALGEGSRDVPATSPVAVAGDLEWAAIAAGTYRTCGLTTAGALYCWGSGGNTVPDYMVGSPAFGAVAVGVRHACAVTAAGAAYCWGDNERGQLGTGSTATSWLPLAVAGGHAFVAIAPGDNHTCALAADSTAWCWGDNHAGQLGTGSIDALPTTAPAAVTGGLKFTAIGAGWAYTCALAAGGSAYCWGDNSFNRLGIVENSSAAPAPVTGGLTYVALGSGWGGSCGLTPDRALYCWGGRERVSAGPIGGPLRFSSFSAGSSFMCGISVDGIAYCWGENFQGQLGDGTTTSTQVPVRVVGQ